MQKRGESIVPIPALKQLIFIKAKARVLTAKSKPPPLAVVYNISKKINSKAMPLKAFWLGNHHLLCRWSFTHNPEY